MMLSSFSKTFLFGLILFTAVKDIYAECTNQIFLEQSEVTNYYRRRSRTTIPSLDFRNSMISKGLGKSQDQPLDFDRYELMLHASNTDKGLMIWRVCESGTDYQTYGPILQKPIRGFVIEFSDMYSVDRYLSYYNFQTYATSRQFIQKTEQERISSLEREYAVNHPIKNIIWKIAKTIMYLFLGMICISPLL